MEPADVPVNIAFSDERFYPQLLYGSTRLRAFLLCLAPGQRLPARQDSQEAFRYLPAGRGRLTPGDRVLTIAAARPGERRGPEAAEPMAARWLQISAGAGIDG
jgi:hypothetical protein